MKGSGLKYEGQGYKFANGNVYHGEWKEDKSHGKGKYIFKNGNTYIGDFSNGKEDGKEHIRIQQKKYNEILKVGKELTWNIFFKINT